MDYDDRPPDSIPVEEYVRRAHAERSAFIAYWLGNVSERIARGIKRIGAVMGHAMDAQQEWRDFQTESLARTAVKRY